MVWVKENLGKPKEKTLNIMLTNFNQHLNPFTPIVRMIQGSIRTAKPRQNQQIQQKAKNNNDTHQSKTIKSFFFPTCSLVRLSFFVSRALRPSYARLGCGVRYVTTPRMP